MTTLIIIFIVAIMVLLGLSAIAMQMFYKEVTERLEDIKNSTTEKINLAREVICEISEELNTTGDTLTTLTSLISEYKGTLDSLKATLDKIPFSARQAPRTKKKQDSTSM